MTTPPDPFALRVARPLAPLAIAHRATVEAILAAEELLYRDDDFDAGDVLYELGVRPPGRYLDELRRRFPNLYAATEDVAGDEEPLGRAALRAYLEDLRGLYGRLRDLDTDAAHTLDQLGLLDEATIGVAALRDDVRERTLDEIDALIGESFGPTHNVG